MTTAELKEGLMARHGASSPPSRATAWLTRAFAAVHEIGEAEYS